MNDVRGTRVDLAELIGLRQRARELAVGVKRRAHEPRTGMLHSPFRGRGMEYAESRPYSAGDDVRHVDWRVTARSGQLHSKLFHAERERVSAIVYDGSPWTAFGTRHCFKSVQAARLGGLFTWLAHAEGDRVAGVAIGSGQADMPATGGRRGALRLLEHIVRWQPTAPSENALSAAGLDAALSRLQRLLRPGSHVLLLIDPHQVDCGTRQRLMGLAMHHDVIACVLLDPLECELLPRGRYPITDGRERAWLDIDSERSAIRLRQHFLQLRSTCLQNLRHCGVRAHEVRTDQDPVTALRDLLRGVIKSERVA